MGLSPPNEKEKELSNSLVREDESIEFVAKLKVLLKDNGISQKPKQNFYCENNPHLKMKIENQNCKLSFLNWN